MLENDPENYLREVFYLNVLRHPNIVMFKDTWMTLGKMHGHLSIAMEYVNGGTLESTIKKLSIL